MNKVTFTPLSIAAGMLAGFAASKIFELIWSRIDEEDAPEPDQRDVPWGKLMLASALDGAVFRMVSAATNRGSRIAYMRATGVWPGEDD